MRVKTLNNTLNAAKFLLLTPHSYKDSCDSWSQFPVPVNDFPEEFLPGYPPFLSEVLSGIHYTVVSESNRSLFREMVNKARSNPDEMTASIPVHFHGKVRITSETWKVVLVKTVNCVPVAL